MKPFILSVLSLLFTLSAQAAPGTVALKCTTTGFTDLDSIELVETAVPGALDLLQTYRGVTVEAARHLDYASIYGARSADADHIIRLPLAAWASGYRRELLIYPNRTATIVTGDECTNFITEATCAINQLK